MVLNNCYVVPAYASRNGIKGAFCAGVMTEEHTFIEDTALRRHGKNFSFSPKRQNLLSLPSIDEAFFGGYIYLHYGHFLLETLSFLTNVRDFPDIPIIWLRGESFTKTQIEILNGLGVKNQHIFLKKPTKVKTLFLDTPGFRIGEFFTKEHAKFLGFFKPKPIVLGRKCWLSRSSLGDDRGKVIEEKQIEELLLKEGWNIFFPEQHSIIEQLEYLSSCERIAGWAGSAFHTFILLETINSFVDIFIRGSSPNETYPLIARVKKINQKEHSTTLIPVSGSGANAIYSVDGVEQVIQQLESNLQKSEEKTKTPNSQFNGKLLMNKKLTIKNEDKQKSSTDQRKKVNHSARRINKLAKEMDANNYLEIGVNKGLTFFNVSVPERTAVDLKFLFDITSNTDKGVTLKEETSDDFFSALPLSHKYDLIFIDGLHTFEQTYRDLCNSLFHSHEKTVFLIDDTKPSDVYSAVPQQEKSLHYRKQASHSGRQWHGDVFKVIFTLHDFYPALNYRTIIGSGNPQTLVWASNSGWRKPLFNSLETISRLSYFDFIDHIDIMRECSEEEAMKLCLDELS